MLKSILKWILFACLMLWVGQVRVGEKTIGAHFEGQVTKLWNQGRAQVFGTKILADLSNSVPRLKELAPKGAPSKDRSTEKKRNKKESRPSNEDVSASDRESLLRLLQ